MKASQEVIQFYIDSLQSTIAKHTEEQNNLVDRIEHDRRKLEKIIITKNASMDALDKLESLITCKE